VKSVKDGYSILRKAAVTATTNYKLTIRLLFEIEQMSMPLQHQTDTKKEGLNRL